MAVTRIQIDGLKELNRSIRAVDSGLKRQVADANFQAATTLIETAKRSPKFPERTGRLKRSLKASKTIGYAQATAGRGNTIPYAPPIHWGWKSRGIKPQPFFAIALNYSYQEIMSNYDKQIQKLIDRNGL